MEAESLGEGHALASWGGLGAEETAGCLETECQGGCLGPVAKLLRPSEFIVITGLFSVLFPASSHNDVGSSRAGMCPSVHSLPQLPALSLALSRCLIKNV